MSRKVDDIIFGMAKTGAKATGDFAGAAATKAVRYFDPSSVVKSMGRGSFFQNINLPDIPLTSSKLFHTGDHLKLLKNVGLDDLIPKDTASLLKGLSKQADDVAGNVAGKIVKQADDVAGKTDAGALKRMANNKLYI